jgi:hypothetical protein
MTARVRRVAIAAAMSGASACYGADVPIPLDLAIPESPASSALSGSSETILKPSSLREFAASLINMVDQKGKFAPGVAFEVSPYMLATGPARVRGYEEPTAQGAALRALVGTQLSLATGSKDKDTGRAQQVAVGVRVPIFDNGDPRLDPVLNDCFKRAIAPPKVDKLPPPDDIKETEDLPADVVATTKKCYALSRAKLWNASSLVFAAAQLYSDTGGSDQSHLSRDSTTYWVAYALPIGVRKAVPTTINRQTFSVDTQPGQLIAQLQARRHAIGDGTTPVEQRRYDSEAAALKLRWGSDKLNVSIGASNERRKYDFDGHHETARIYSGGFEGRLKKDFWVRLNVGAEKSPAANQGAFGSLVFSWATESEPALDPRPKPQ